MYLNNLKLDITKPSNITTTYLLSGALVVIVLMIILIKDPFHIIRADKATPFLNTNDKQEINQLSIIINNLEQKVTLKDEQWLVETSNNVPADQLLIEAIINKSLSLERTELVSKNEINQAQFGVDEKGIKVSINNKDEVIADFYVGKAGPDFLSTYIRKAGEPYVYLYPENIRQTFNQPELRDLTILTIGKDSIAKIEGRENGNGLVVERQEDKWVITKPLRVELSETAMTPLLTLLSNFKAVDVNLGLEEELTGFNSPAKRFIITANEQDTTILVGNIITNGNPQDNTKYYLQKEGDERVFTITQEMFNKIPTRIADLPSEED